MTLARAWQDESKSYRPQQSTPCIIAWKARCEPPERQNQRPLIQEISSSSRFQFHALAQRWKKSQNCIVAHCFRFNQVRSTSPFPRRRNISGRETGFFGKFLARARKVMIDAQHGTRRNFMSSVLGDCVAPFINPPDSTAGELEHMGVGNSGDRYWIDDALPPEKHFAMRRWRERRAERVIFNYQPGWRCLVTRKAE